jgi:RNA polymerase sigma-70 factor (ECF subfamily)
MPQTDPDTEELLRRAPDDAQARGALLDRHRGRLRRMVALRLDPRLAARVDPSDVVQETLAEADRRLDGYLKDRPLPFYPWLRQIAADRLADEHRRHIGAARRSLRREELPGLPGGSVLELADRLLDRGVGPSEAARGEELRARVRAALEGLPERDREVLVLRHLEQLSVREIAAVLGIAEGAVKVRHLRAVQRLRVALDRGASEGRA